MMFGVIKLGKTIKVELENWFEKELELRSNSKKFNNSSSPLWGSSLASQRGVELLRDRYSGSRWAFSPDV